MTAATSERSTCSTMTSQWFLLGRDRLRSNLRSDVPAFRDRLDLEPDGIQGRQEYERENRPGESSADQGVRQRSPEDGVGERNEGQHGRERRQDDRTGALHGGLDDGLEWR